MKLLIDDTRYRDDVDIIARTYEAGLELIDNDDLVIDTIYFDHDLGDLNPAQTGYKLLKVCLDKHQFTLFPKKIGLITCNIIGFERMEKLLFDFKWQKIDSNLYIF